MLAVLQHLDFCRPGALDSQPACPVAVPLQTIKGRGTEHVVALCNEQLAGHGGPAAGVDGGPTTYVLEVSF